MKYIKSSNGKFVQKKDYSKKIILLPNDFQEKGHLLQMVIVPPNTKQRAHFHNKQIEVWYVLEGEAHFFLSNVDYFLKPGDTLMAGLKDVHYVWNKSDKEFRLLVFKTNLPENDDDTIWLEN